MWQGSAAAAEFQKILYHPGVARNELIGSLAHLGLGRAHKLSGDTANAQAAYQDFLALWKDADPDIPILQQAKAEYNERNQENALVMQAKLQQTAIAHAKFFESFLKSLLKPYAIAENFRST